jgi:hypothetical protein
MTDATRPVTNGDVLHQRLAQMRAWRPASEKYRDLWRTWKAEAQHLIGAPPGQRVCGYCAGINRAGEHESGFLHWECWRRVVKFDAERVAGEAGDGAFTPIAHEPTSAKARLWQAVLALPEPITLAALVLAAWRADPETFGLDGCKHDHPDSAHVRNDLYGPAGLLTRGYLVRKGKVYHVTPAGRALAGGKGAGR